MRILTQALLLTGALLGCAASQAADTQDFDVLKAMSVADFRATGLDHLTGDQVKALNAWFAEYQRSHPACAAGGAAPAAAPAMAAPAAAAAPAATAAFPEVIVAHLEGDFRGWGDATLFKLDNGQVWQQVDDSELSVGAIKNPKVTIKRGIFSTYYLSVEGVNDSIAVRLLKP